MKPSLIVAVLCAGLANAQAWSNPIISTTVFVSQEESFGNFTNPFTAASFDSYFRLGEVSFILSTDPSDWGYGDLGSSYSLKSATFDKHLLDFPAYPAVFGYAGAGHVELDSPMADAILLGSSFAILLTGDYTFSQYFSALFLYDFYPPVVGGIVPVYLYSEVYVPDITIHVDVTEYEPMPEPSIIALLGIGFFAMSYRSIRKLKLS